MKKIKNYFLAFTVVAISASSVLAQEVAAPAPAQTEKFPKANKFNTWTLGLNVGPTITHGDVGGDNLGDVTMGFGFGGYVNKSLTHTIALQGNLFMGSLKGEGERRNGAFKYKEDFETKINYEYFLFRVLPKIPKIPGFYLFQVVTRDLQFIISSPFFDIFF